MSITENTETTDVETAEDRHRARIVAQAAALRAFADFAEQHAEAFPDYLLGHDFGIWGIPNAEEMTRLALALGGKWSKHAIGNYFSLERDFGGSEFVRVKLSLNTNRENVCERKQVGTETKLVPDPGLVEEIPLVEVEEPIFEWVCPDSLLEVRAEDFAPPATEDSLEDLAF